MNDHSTSVITGDLGPIHCVSGWQAQRYIAVPDGGKKATVNQRSTVQVLLRVYIDTELERKHAFAAELKSNLGTRTAQTQNR